MAIKSQAMPIRFRFDLERSLHAMTYIVDRLGAVEKIKIIKLLYIADRDHFLRFGHPITGDRQCAMKHGPVGSDCLHALDGDAPGDPEAAFKYLQIVNNMVLLREKPTSAWLTDEEKTTLDAVLQKYGATPKWELRDQTHEFPEYKEYYVEGTSTTIPYEAILRHYKGEDGYRKNRPVLTEAILSKMVFPFTAQSDADL